MEKDFNGSIEARVVCFDGRSIKIIRTKDVKHVILDLYQEYINNKGKTNNKGILSQELNFCFSGNPGVGKVIL